MRQRPQEPAPAGPAVERVRSTNAPGEIGVRPETALARAFVPGRADPPWTPWVEALRAAGAPDRLLAAVVLSDFDERWDQRYLEFQRKFDSGEADEEDLAVLNREHELAVERELRRALGDDGYKRWDQENTLRNLNLRSVTLTSAEAEAVYELQKGLEHQLRELELAKDTGELDDADFNERQNQAQAELDQRLRVLLGEKRFATMHGADDSGAGELRRSLRTVNASDAQFEALLEAQREWAGRRAELDRQLQSNQAQNIAYEDQIIALDQERDREYQRVLGTNAFEAYQKQQDARYTRMQHYAANWGLDENAIEHLYRALSYYDKSVGEYQSQARALEQQGQPVDWDGVSRNLQQFSKQTEDMLREYLGHERFERLKRNGLFPFE